MTRRTAGAALTLTFAVVVSLRVHAQVSAERIANAAKEPQNWLTYSGGYFSNRFSNVSPLLSLSK